MFKLMKIIFVTVALAIIIVGYGIVSWHVYSKPTLWSVERKCNLIELAKDYCTDKSGTIDQACLSNEIPKETMWYYIKDFVFGHKCIDEGGE